MNALKININYSHQLLGVMMILLFGAKKMNAQGFECTDDIYLAAYNDLSKKSSLYIIDPNNDFQYQELLLSEDRHLTGLGYSIVDKHLYALDFNTYELLKINAEGTIYNLGVPNNLDTSFKYYSGTVNPLGTALRVIARNEEGIAERYYSINLFREDNYAGWNSVISNQDIASTDLALDPYRGIMYGFDIVRNEPFEISSGATVNTNNFTPGTLPISAIFFDKQGLLYGYRDNGDLYSIVKTNGKATKIGSLPPSSFADAASCSVTYIFEKTVEERTILPCDTFTINYEFINRLGIGQAGMELRDTFPPGYEIVDVDLKYYYGDPIVLDPPNVLFINDFDIVLDINSIQVKVVASADTAAWSSQGFLYTLPSAVGEVTYSDDPNTEKASDGTLVTLDIVDTYQLEDYIVSGCNESAVIVESPLPRADHLWHDGSTFSYYKAKDTGWVSVLAIDDCNVFEDSVYIGNIPSARYVDIEGMPSDIKFGDEVTLSFSTNLESPYRIAWQVNGNAVSSDEELSLVVEEGSLIVLNLFKDECNVGDVVTTTMSTTNSVYIPNVFSPNGDGVNDDFIISAATNGSYNLKIYDRWGGLMLDREDVSFSDASSSWRGQMDGLKTSDNIYVYVVELFFADGSRETRSGEVLVMYD